MKAGRITRPKDRVTYNDPMYRKLQAIEDAEDEILSRADLDRLREVIKRYRTRSGLSQLDLALMLGIEQSNVCLWETGKTTPTLFNLAQLADVFGLKLWALLKEAGI